jgi:protease secretion system outer membrane protein
MRSIILTLVCMAGLGLAHADSFHQIYEAALLNDAAFQVARAELDAARQNLPMAQAGLMPNLAISISEAKVAGTRTSNNSLGQPFVSELDYAAPNRALNLRVPLLNWEATQKIKQAHAQVSHAEAVFRARQFEMLERLTTTIQQRSEALQNVKLAVVQVDAAQAQRRQMRRLWEQGEGTRPEDAEAAALLELAESQLLEARSHVELTEMNFRQIVGPSWQGPTSGAPSERVVPPLIVGLSVPNQPLGELLVMAEAENPALAVRRHAVTIAQAAVARNRAGHYPRLDLVASVSSVRNESLSTLNQAANQRSVGLQLSIPIFSGGYVNASVTQALAELTKAEAELLVERQSVARDVSKQYFAVVIGASKLKAHHAAEEAASSALDGLRKGLKAGFNTATDVVLGQRKLAQTQMESTQVHHETLLASVRLHFRTGGGVEQAVEQFEAALLR